VDNEHHLLFGYERCYTMMLNETKGLVYIFPKISLTFAINTNDCQLQIELVMNLGSMHFRKLICDVYQKNNNSMTKYYGIRLEMTIGRVRSGSGSDRTGWVSLIFWKKSDRIGSGQFTFRLFGWMYVIVVERNE
jgi:hypothetical protein